MTAEQIARAFHEAYVRLAPAYADGTPGVPAIPWAGISTQDRALMAAVVQDLTDNGIIHPGGDAEMLRRHGVERCAQCGVVLRSHDAMDHPWMPGSGPSDEDRIRDAMTEAHNHPGRTITR